MLDFYQCSSEKDYEGYLQVLELTLLSRMTGEKAVATAIEERTRADVTFIWIRLKLIIVRGDVIL